MSQFSSQTVQNIRDIVFFSQSILGLELNPGQKYWLENAWKPVNILKPANQWGKGITIGSIVLTPNGWVKAGKVKIGDYFYSQNGTKTKVEGVYPQGFRNTYRFIFDDGSSCSVDESHLWYCQTSSGRFRKNFNENGKDYKNRKYKSWEVLSTKEIINNWGLNPSPYNRISIPVVEPIQFKERGVSIEPYLLGLLLGDGCLRRGVSLCIADSDILEGLSVRWRKKSGSKYDYVLYGLTEEIKRLGLFNKYSYKKFIPQDYLFNSVENRLAILQGLMDTDGNIETNGKVEYCTTSKQLKDDVTFLVQSFGGKVKTTERYTQYTYKEKKKTGRLSYRLRIKMSFNPFRLKRKADRFYITEKTYNRILHKIELLGKKKTVCFRVDHPSSLYVVKDFIVTHNTTAEAVAHIYQAVCKPQLDRFNLTENIWSRTRYQTLNFGKTYEVAKGVMEAITDITEGQYLLPSGEFNNSALAGWAIRNIEDIPKLPKIIWYNKSETLIRSYDNMGESFKRLKLAFISGDECGDIPELNLFLNGTLMPRTFFFGASIHLVGTSQPKGVEYETLAELAEEDIRQKDTASNYFVISANNNPKLASVYQNNFIPVEHLKKIEEIADPNLRRQIIYGFYVDWANHLYMWDEINQVFTDKIPYDPETGLSEAPVEGGYYVFATDMAASEDETSCTCIKYNNKKSIGDDKFVNLPHRVVFHKAWKGKSLPLSLQYAVIKEYFRKFKVVSPHRTKFLYDAGSLGGKNTAEAFKDLQGYPFPPQGRSYAEIKAEAMGVVKEVLGMGREFTIDEKGKRIDKNLEWGGIKASNLLKELRRQLEIASKDDDKIKNDQFTSLMMALHFIERRQPKMGHIKAVDFNFSKSLLAR